MTKMDIDNFEAVIRERLDNAESHSEKWDYLEGIKDALSALKVNDVGLNDMLSEMNEQVNIHYNEDYER
jgi:hypothetical protein